MKLPTILTKKILAKRLFKIIEDTATRQFWQSLKMPPPTLEFKFHPIRRWRIDYAWPEVKLAVEKEGGVYKKNKDGSRGGRHNHPKGFLKDMEKYNALTEAGWYLLRYQPNKFNYTQIQKVYMNLLHVEHKL